jgi:hypothetical protein
MCKEMPVIPVSSVVDPKRIMGKMEGQVGGKAQGVANPSPKKRIVSILGATSLRANTPLCKRCPRSVESNSFPKLSVRSDNEELKWQLRRQEIHRGDDTASRFES